MRSRVSSDRYEVGNLDGYEQLCSVGTNSGCLMDTKCTNPMDPNENYIRFCIDYILRIRTRISLKLGMLASTALLVVS